MGKITEIIPDDLPEWAIEAIAEGNFFREAVKNRINWISVKDRLPAQWNEVLIYPRPEFNDVDVYTGIYAMDKWICYVSDNYGVNEFEINVTHFCEIPPPPGE